MRKLFVSVALAALTILPAVAKEEETKDAPQSTEEIVAREKVRAAVESILADLHQVSERPPGEREKFYRDSEKLLAIGPAAGPFLAEEISRNDATTFNVVTYVLGQSKAPEAIPALRKSIEASDAEPTKFAFARKQWAAYGLALAGDPSVVDLLAAGTHDVAPFEFMEDMRLLEVSAILTAPASLPLLVAQLDRYAKDEAQEAKLDVTLLAIGRVGDPSAAPQVAALLSHRRWQARRAATIALGNLGDPSVCPKLFALLDDESLHVRFGAAFAIAQLLPKDQVRTILSRLEVEKQTQVRIQLYQTLASVGGEGMIEAFGSHWGRPDFLDRIGIVNAIAELGSKKGLGLLREAVKDRDLGVVIQAMRAMQRIGGGGATDTLLALLNDGRWPVQETAIEILDGMREPRAAPRIADLMLKRELATPSLDVSAKTRLEKMGEALVDLRYAEPLSDLKEAARLQTEPQVVSYLSGFLARLEALAANQDDVRKWIGTMASPDPALRKLAFSRLGDLASPEAVRALVSAFPQADAPDGVEILRALGRTRSAEADALVERVLSEASFDAWIRWPQRSMAAWAAREIGGEPMGAALRRSAERREGRDLDVLVYLAVLTGKDAVPTLRAMRVPRLRYFEWGRGPETDRIDWIVHELSAGRSIAKLDHPPEEIALP